MRLRWMLESVRRAAAEYERFELFVVSWFVRIAWPTFVVLGLVALGEVFLRDLSGGALEDKKADAAIRLFGGVTLGLIWFFLIRRLGRRRPSPPGSEDSGAGPA